MHKELHLLGLLQNGPRTGYDLHRIVAAHGELFTDLKKGNVYYLLERLAESGALQVTAEAGARGPRRERLIYSLTDEGRRRFHELLRAVMRTYEVAHSGVEVGMIFLPYLEPREIVGLLEERHQAVLARREVVDHQAAAAGHLHEHLAQDHLLAMMDAELAWIARVLQHLRERQEGPPLPQNPPTALPRCSGERAADQE
jgi:DNA-binding PadR family transcriptional regulator